MNLMPVPRKMLPGSGHTRLAGFDGFETKGAESPRLAGAVSRLERRLASVIGASVPGDAKRRRVRLDIASGPASEYPSLGDDERYRVEIAANRICIEASREWGVLRALATLAQLVRREGGEGHLFPHCEIEDAPRFPWRGLMIDTARHFISVGTLERTLDVMELYKLNVLHLHLSDDQGFRFPAAAHPELADRRAHYTRPELASLVRRAAARGIRVIPELDVPGHTASWLAAHPEWGMGAPISAVSTRFGVHACCLDPDNPAAMRAVATLFGELSEVFPDSHAHFGGDEVTLPDGRDTARAHTAFNARMADILHGLGKSPVGWDEIIQPDLPRSVVIQSWRGAAARSRALDAGFDTVHSAPYYLDLFYPADLHYAFDPETDAGVDLSEDPRLAHVRDGLSALSRRWEAGAGATSGSGGGRVLGGEACLWTELVTDELLDTRLWSRMPAIAERFWSPADVRDADDMYRRLAATQATLARMGVVDPVSGLRRRLTRSGLSDDDARGMMPLIEMLEPVKWYARLLGSSVPGAVDGDRPYDTGTPLDRVVDFIPPESLAARRLTQVRDEHRLREIIVGWRRQRDRVKRCSRHAVVRELTGVSETLFRLAEQLDAHLHGRQARIPDAAFEPHGEYMLAVALHLADRFSPSRTCA